MENPVTGEERLLELTVTSAVCTKTVSIRDQGWGQRLHVREVWARETQSSESGY